MDASVPASSLLSNSKILAVFPGPPRSRKQQACVIKELKRKNGETGNEFEAWNTLVLRKKKNHFDASSLIGFALLRIGSSAEEHASSLLLRPCRRCLLRRVRSTLPGVAFRRIADLAELTAFFFRRFPLPKRGRIPEPS